MSILRTSYTAFSSTTFKSLSDIVNKNEIDRRCSNKLKNSLIFSMSQKPARVDYLPLGAKKILNFLQNAFIQAPVFQN